MRDFALRSFILSSLAVSMSLGCAREPTTPAARTPASAPTGRVYGAAPSLADVTPLDRILAQPESFRGRVVRTGGTIRAVCQHMGCWFDIGAPSETEGRLHVRSPGHSIVVPTDSAGRYAEVEGELQPLPGHSACAEGNEGPGHAHDENTPACGAPGAGRRYELALRGVVIRPPSP